MASVRDLLFMLPRRYEDRRYEERRFDERPRDRHDGDGSGYRKKKRGFDIFDIFD